MATEYLHWRELVDQGRTACGQNDFTAAERYFLAAVQEAQKSGEMSSDLQSALGHLALFYHYIVEDYPKAEAVYQRELAIMKHIQGPRSREIGGQMTFLADVQLKQQKYREARASMETHVAITIEKRGATHPDTASAYHALAQTLVAMGEISLAEQAERRAIQIEGEQPKRRKSSWNCALKRLRRCPSNTRVQPTPLHGHKSAAILASGFGYNAWPIYRRRG
jgi:cytochrome c-type biogenesis protein CcmH/NrfG